MPADQRKSVAIYRIGQMGDALVALPAIRTIRLAHPDADLILITNVSAHATGAAVWGVLKSTGILNDVLSYPPLLPMIAAVRKRRPESLFYLAPYPRSAWQRWRDWIMFRLFCGIRHIHGLNPVPLPPLRNQRGELGRIPSEMARLFSIAAQKELSAAAPVPSLWDFPKTTSDQECIAQIWKERDLSNRRPLIAVAPGSRMPANRWPIERFAQLGKILVEKFPQVTLVILGGAEDAPLGESLRSAVGPAVVNLAGRLTIAQSAEALRQCSLYIGNDTGVMHLAAAVGCRCVAIFSARNRPGKWDPCGSGHIVLRKDVPCAGCLLTVCIQKKMLCLREIQVEEVLGACLQCLPGVPHP